MKSDEELWAELEGSSDRFMRDSLLYPDTSDIPQPREPMRDFEEVEFLMFATKGTNLIGVGWRNGVLRARFANKNGPKLYDYPGVPESTKTKLVNSPFPDGLFTKLVRNKGFKAEAVLDAQ